MSNCPASTACPGAASIVPLTRLVRTTVPAALAKTPSAFPAAMSGTGFAAAASTTSRPSRKFRLAQENSPLCKRAYSPAVSFSCVTALPGISCTCSRRIASARARCPVVRLPASTAQTRSCDQTSRGTNSKTPTHSPRRRRKGRSRKYSPVRV